MEIGRKIYYDKSTGTVIWDKGEMSGDVVETTFEEDCAVMPLLSLMNTNGTLSVARLNYGDYASEFATCKGFIINPETGIPQIVS